MIADFFAAAAGLKSVPRQGWMDKLGMHSPESVADHSYMVALMSSVLAAGSGVDASRAVRMALLHDLAESRIGDLVPGQVPDDRKREMEDGAMRQILADLPEPARSYCQDAWDDFQRGESAEAVFVREVDKLEMALQAVAYARDGAGRDVTPFLDSAREVIRDGPLRDVLDQVASGLPRSGKPEKQG